jgi:hypothetical protein
MTTTQHRWWARRRLGALALAVLLGAASVLAACGDDSGDPDPGKTGGDHTEVDGSEAGDTGGSTSTSMLAPTGGSEGGATQGNQVVPGESTTVPDQGSQTTGG